jgi:hypothetical protein
MFKYTCNEPAALWCPAKAEYGTPHLVCGSFHKPNQQMKA